MKKTRRIAAFAAAMAMAATMAMPMAMTASATNVTVKTTGVDNAEHTYKAYQIFTGTQTEAGLTINGWAEKYNSADLLIDDDFTDLFTDIDSSSTAVQVAQAIEKLNYANESEGANNLAKLLQKYIGNEQLATELTDTAADLAAGYWIVVDEYNPAEDASGGNKKPDAYSQYILRVTGGSEPINITPKKDYPTVIKKVQEKSITTDQKITFNGEENYSLGVGYNDVADYCIGDTVPFRLYGTLPSRYDDYKSYYYKFNDTLGSQFTLNNDSIKIAVDGTDVTLASTGKANLYTVTKAGKTTDVWVISSGTKLEVIIEDVKVLTTDKESVITVSYDAVLNNTAEIGLPGQENKVDLTYSNNPNVEYNPKNEVDNPKGSEDKPEDNDDTKPDKPQSETPGTPGTPGTPKDETDTTPEDKVIVFTYELDVNKIDSDGSLAGAQFVVYREKSDKTKEYATVTGNRFSGWTSTAPTALTLAADATAFTEAQITAAATTGVFISTGEAAKPITIAGLDDGTYYLEEIAAPASYNKIDGAIPLTIASTHKLNAESVPVAGPVQDWDTFVPANALRTLTLSSTNTTDVTIVTGKDAEHMNLADGLVSADVANTKGINLPITGGMGTRLFVLGGGCMAGLAGLYLVSKKRSKDAE